MTYERTIRLSNNCATILSASDKGYVGKQVFIKPAWYINDR